MSKVIDLLNLIIKNRGNGPELWIELNIILSDSKNEEILTFCNDIKNKLNYSDDQALFSLDIIDFCIDNGNIELAKEISSKNFLSGFITKLKNGGNGELISKILYLIKKWGLKFADDQILANFSILYQSLLQNKVIFPERYDNNYRKYTEKKTPFTERRHIYNRSNYGCPEVNKVGGVYKEISPENYIKEINVDLFSSSYEKQYRHLVNKLYDLTHEIQEANILINQNIGNKNNQKISYLYQELTEGKRQLVGTIRSNDLKNEKLMDISLKVIDDIEMTIKRWEQAKRGIQPDNFVSSFFQMYRNETPMNSNSYKKSLSSYTSNNSCINCDNLGNSKNSAAPSPLLDLSLKNSRSHEIKNDKNKELSIINEGETGEKIKNQSQVFNNPMNISSGMNNNYNLYKSNNVMGYSGINNINFQMNNMILNNIKINEITNSLNNVKNLNNKINHSNISKFSNNFPGNNSIPAFNSINSQSLNYPYYEEVVVNKNDKLLNKINK